MTSSNDRLPLGGWGRTWALTVLLVSLPLSIWEVWWRVKGFGPGVEAGDESWIMALHDLPRATTVALGSSRIQAALDPGAFRQEAGGAPVVNLALPASSPIPVLEYLADSTVYTGTVIVEILPMFAFDATQYGARRGIGLIQRYARDRVSPARLTENWLRVHLLNHLVFRTTQLLPGPLTKTLRRGSSVELRSTRMRTDRFAPVNHRRFLANRTWDSVGGFRDISYQTMARAGRPADDAEYAALKNRILIAANRVIDRGGTVVLLYIAACGERRRIEERRYPRAQYWDPLAQESRAIAIATEDYPELSNFACWDGSHIDAADAPAWAKALEKVIRRAHPRA